MVVTLIISIDTLSHRRTSTTDKRIDRETDTERMTNGKRDRQTDGQAEIGRQKFTLIIIEKRERRKLK